MKEGEITLEHPEPELGSPHEISNARSRLMSNRRARRLRRFWRMLPSAPRCKICTSPFGPPLGPVLRLVGKGRWPGNPTYCCFKDLYKHREGAEVECTLFFADIRGSTGLAESMTPNEYRALLNRFYAVAADILVSHERRRGQVRGRRGRRPVRPASCYGTSSAGSSSYAARPPPPTSSSSP